MNNKIIGWKLLGQKFSDDKYFCSRPSAVDYNAAGSGASNKGTTNPDYLVLVQRRIDSILTHNPGTRRQDVTSDLVTASGSGLDPDISVGGAYVQVKRIAAIRNTSEEKIKTLVDQHLEKPIFGLFGTERVNLLKLNMDLDKLK
jgi:K+-transporting ATPase ATPase C chain